MKKLNLLFLAFSILLTASCSSDDSNSDENEETTSNYFPLTVSNSWTYNNEFVYEDGNTTNTQETLSISSLIEEQGVSYYSLNSDASIEDQGFVTGLLANGQLTVADNQLIYNGELELDATNLGIVDTENIVIPLINIIIFDADANVGDELSENEDSFTQSVDIQGVDVPFTFDYTITSTQNSFYESYTAGEQIFEDVISSNITVNIEINASFFGVDIPVLEPQDAVQITNYYANNVGMIYSETAINYNFEEINIPTISSIPDYQFDITQEIDSHTIIE